MTRAVGVGIILTKSIVFTEIVKVPVKHAPSGGTILDLARDADLSRRADRRGDGTGTRPVDRRDGRATHALLTATPSPGASTAVRTVGDPGRHVDTLPASTTEWLTGRDRGPLVDPSPLSSGPSDRGPGPQPESGPAPDRQLRATLRSPGLVLLAAAALLEGYRQLGVVDVGRSWLSTFVSGRVGTALVAGAFLSAALVLSRWGWESSRSPGRIAVPAAGSAVVLASLVQIVTHGPAAGRAVDVADLVLAAASAGTVVLAEHARRRAGEDDTTRSDGTAF